MLGKEEVESEQINQGQLARAQPSQSWPQVWNIHSLTPPPPPINYFSKLIKLTWLLTLSRPSPINYFGKLIKPTWLSGDAAGDERRPPRATKLLPWTPLWSHVPGLLSKSSASASPSYCTQTLFCLCLLSESSSPFPLGTIKKYCCQTYIEDHFVLVLNNISQHWKKTCRKDRCMWAKVPP